MRHSKSTQRVAILGLLGAATLLAQDAPLSNSSISINLPTDSPVVLLKIDTGTSRTTARGSVLMLDLKIGLTLRNTSPNRIHGVTLRVVSQEVATGGVGSVYQPSLNVGPGEAFPVHIDTHLMRPAQLGGPLLQVNLDGVLFQDLSFYGQDKLHSRRIMIASEMEAQRDRVALKNLMAQRGADGLKDGVLKILARREALPSLQGRIHTVTSAAIASVTPTEHKEQFALVQFPDSPIELKQGSALIAGSEARAPSIVVQNRTDKAVKYVELGWVLTDANGRTYLAGSLPSSDPAFALPPHGTGQVKQENSLEFSSKGQPLNIKKVTSFPSQVEFADGTVWVPARQNLDSNPLILQVVEPSVEEERLANIYRIKGPAALMQELNKY